VFATYLQLPKYVLRIYVVRCFKLVPGILYGDFLLFYMQLFLQLLSSVLESCPWIEILSQQRIRHFKILQSIYFAYDVGIISSYSDRFFWKV